MTTECCCTLCPTHAHQPIPPPLSSHPSIPHSPSPGIYAVTTLPVLSLTLAIFLSPEFGFFGFVVPTFRHTPFISGRSASAGDVGLRARCATRQPRRTWLNVAGRGVVVVKARVGDVGRRIDRGVEGVGGAMLGGR